MKILVTGAGGFIGRYLSVALTERGDVVIPFDIAGAASSALDVRSLPDVRGTIAGVDGVVHLAAVSRTSIAEKNPYDTIQINLLGTTNVLEAARKRPHPPWIVVASSRAAFEAGTRSLYALTKDTADRMVDYYSHRFDLATICLRLSDVYGSIAATPGRLVTELVERAERGVPLQIEKGNLPFDFIHYEDVIRGILLAINLVDRARQLRRPHFHKVSLATGRQICAAELADIVCRTLESKSRIEVRDRQSRFPELPLDAGCALAHEAIGFRSSITLEQGLIKMAKMGVY